MVISVNNDHWLYLWFRCSWCWLRCWWWSHSRLILLIAEEVSFNRPALFASHSRLQNKGTVLAPGWHYFQQRYHQNCHQKHQISLCNIKRVHDIICTNNYLPSIAIKILLKMLNPLEALKMIIPVHCPQPWSLRLSLLWHNRLKKKMFRKQLHKEKYLSKQNELFAFLQPAHITLNCFV